MPSNNLHSKKRPMGKCLYNERIIKLANPSEMLIIIVLWKKKQGKLTQKTFQLFKMYKLHANSTKCCSSSL